MVSAIRTTKPDSRAGSASGGTTNLEPIFRSSGFTLIELIVVISLIGLMLFFSLPRLQINPFLDEGKKSARWLISKIRTLKEKSVSDQKHHTLHIDLDSGRMWETNESMTQEDIESAALNSYDLPEDIRIIDVEFPLKGKISSGQIKIAFNKGGYTDKVMLHLQEGERYLSFLVEPFLPEVTFFESYASFHD